MVVFVVGFEDELVVEYEIDVIDVLNLYLVV